MIKTITPQRQTDIFGSGAFGASRGRRIHRGIDFACHPGSTILSSTIGTVSRVGWPYSPEDPDKGHLRYVEVITPLGYQIRYMYVEPLVKQGDTVSRDQPLGIAQDLTEVYNGITPHIHVEVKKESEYIDPSIYFGEM